MVLFVDYLQSRSVGEGAKSIYQRFKKVIRYAIEHDVILKDLTYLKSATPFPKCYLHKEEWTFDS